jgi:hypothetical protein
MEGREVFMNKYMLYFFLSDEATQKSFYGNLFQEMKRLYRFKICHFGAMKRHISHTRNILQSMQRLYRFKVCQFESMKRLCRFLNS